MEWPDEKSYTSNIVVLTFFFFNEKENKFLTYFIHTYMYLYVCTTHICIDASSPMPSLVCICLLYFTHSIVVFRKIHTCHMWILHFLFIFCVEFVIWSDFDFVWNKIIAAPIYLSQCSQFWVVILRITYTDCKRNTIHQKIFLCERLTHERRIFIANFKTKQILEWF